MAGPVTYLQLLSGVKTALGVLRLSEVPGFQTDSNETAFGAVTIYAHESLAAAIQDALTFADRLAFIVPTERSFENTVDGRTLKSLQTLGFVLLLADRSYANRIEATVGNTETPGVIALSELVLQKLTGRDLGLVGVCLQPGDGQPFTLSDADKEELTGREVWAQEFTTAAGSLLAERARPGTTRN